MKYTILINQAAVVEAGLHKSTDLVDWAILEYIHSWQTNPEATRINDFVWINYKHFIEEMPLVGLNTKSGVSNRLKKLEELFLIEKIHDEDSRAFCKTTALFHQVTQFKVKKSAKKSVRWGVHENEQSTYNQNKQSKQIIKNNNKPGPQITDPVTLPLVGLTERQKEEAGEKLAQLSQEQRNIAIQSFNKAVSTNTVKTPAALMNGLINLGLKNGLEAIKTVEPIPMTQTPKKPVITDKERENTRLEIMKAFVANKKADLLKEFAERGCVSSRALGTIIEPDLRLAGLFD